MISEVIRLGTRIVIVLDEKGEQIPEYLGKYEDVRKRILAHAPKSAKFFHGIWFITRNPIPRKDW